MAAGRREALVDDERRVARIPHPSQRIDRRDSWEIDGDEMAHGHHTAADSVRPGQPGNTRAR